MIDRQPPPADEVGELGAVVVAAGGLSEQAEVAVGGAPDVAGVVGFDAAQGFVGDLYT